MQLSLDQIEILDAIVTEGSFSAAAKRLGRVQSALSYNIKQLEKRLNVKLLDRRGYRFGLTEAGNVILAEGRVLLSRARRIEHLATQFGSGVEPRLRVIIDGILPTAPIMNALKTLAEAKNATQIQLKVEFLGGVQHRFDSDLADIMLVKDLEPRDHQIALPLWEITCVLVASQQHPLGQTTENLSLEQLQEYQELTVHDSSASAHPDPHVFGGSRVFFLSDFNSKKDALLRGLGFGWMPVGNIVSELATGDLREVSYSAGSRYSFTSYAVHRSDRPLGATGQRFLELIQSTV